MKLLLLKLVVLISTLSLNCNQSKSQVAEQGSNEFLKCLSTVEEIRGKKYSKEGNHFQIELPENWHVVTDFENGLSASDTLAKLEDYDLIGITEFTNEDFDFRTEYNKLIQSLKSKGRVGSMSGRVKVLQEGETEISGNRARWVLVEDEQITELLGDHVRINYFFQVKESKHYYIIYNESYGDDKIENLCQLKKMTNTFRYVK